MQRAASDHKTSLLPGDVRALWQAVWTKAWLIAGITAVAVLLGIGYLVIAKKVYSAKTTIEIEAEEQKLIKADARRPEDRKSEEVLKTIEQNLLSPALVLRLLHRPELTADPAFRARSAVGSEAELQSSVAAKITAKLRLGTRLIDVSVEDENPALAQKIANLLVDEFIRSRFEGHVQTSQASHDFLRQEAERIKSALANSEQELQRYREQYQAVSLEEKQNIVVERLKELNAKVTTAKAERLKIETDRAQLRQLAGGSPERMLVQSSVTAAPEVADLQRKIADKEAEIATLSRRYKAEHPKYLAAVSSLSELKASRDGAILKARDLVGTAFEAAQATERKLEEALREQESLALELSKITISYSALAREVESDRALYQSLLARLKETDVAQGVAPYAVRIDTPAMLPQLPVWPRKSIILLLACCGGFALGLTWVLGRYALDSTLKTVDEAERELGIPSLGAIPKQRGKPRLEETRNLLVQEPHSALAEAFRTLRTTLLISDKEDSHQSVLFASAIPGEGKSFCSINYAISLARQGFRTLLVDADLRLPNVGRVFLGQKKLPGMTDVLRKSCQFDDAVYSTDIENLSVLPAGARLANSTELVGNANVAEFIQAANSRFDYVVIDTAPVHAASETALLVPHVDIVCLVVRAARTPAAVVARALLRLRDSGAHVAGLILNSLPARGGYYYHYQTPEYGRYETEDASRSTVAKP